MQLELQNHYKTPKDSRKIVHNKNSKIINWWTTSNKQWLIVRHFNFSKAKNLSEPSSPKIENRPQLQDPSKIAQKVQNE